MVLIAICGIALKDVCIYLTVAARRKVEARGAGTPQLSEEWGRAPLINAFRDVIIHNT